MAAGKNVYGYLIRAQMENGTSDLGTPSAGLFYFNTSTTFAKLYNGSVWVSLADASTAQTFTNKTHTSPIINNGVFGEIASPSTPAAGYLSVFAKSDHKLYTKDSTGVEAVVGSGSGGEINTIESPNDATNWAASGAGITVATTSTTTDLPLGPVVDTAIKITPVSGTDYVYYRFQIPSSLKSRKLKIQWEQLALSGYASGDLKVDMYTNTASNYGGTYVRVALSTDSSSVSAIPVMTGRFTTTFDTASLDYYELRITRVAGTTALNIANVVVGPGIQPQGAIAVDLGALAVVPLAGSFGTVTANTWRGERVGNWLYAIGSFVTGTCTAGVSTLTLPYDIDTSSITASNTILGHGVVDPNATSPCFVYYKTGDATNVVRLARSVSAGVIDDISASSLVGNSRLISVRLQLPVAQWAGSGTVNLAQNDVEYTSNSSTSTSASDTTSFQYGPAGALIQNITAALARRVRFLTPIQDGDTFDVQLNEGTGWVSIKGLSKNAQNISEYTNQGGTTYGLASTVAIINATDVDVNFGQYAYANNASYGGAGSPWSSNGGSSVKWRVVKQKAGVAVGFGLATSSASGLYKAGSAPGQTSGVTITSGYLGEKISSGAISTTAVASSTFADVTGASLPLTPGVWTIKWAGLLRVDQGGGGAITCKVTDSANTFVGAAARLKTIDSGQATMGGQVEVNISVNTTYKLRIASTGATSSFETADQSATNDAAYAFYAVRTA
jgi:hypothetical protein